MKSINKKITISKLAHKNTILGNSFRDRIHSLAELFNEAGKYPEEFPDGFLDAMLTQVMDSYTVLAQHGFGPKNIVSGGPNLPFPILDK